MTERLRRLGNIDPDIRAELPAPSSADVWDEDGGIVDHEVARLQLRRRQPPGCGSRSQRPRLELMSVCPLVLFVLFVDARFESNLWPSVPQGACLACFRPRTNEPGKRVGVGHMNDVTCKKVAKKGQKRCRAATTHAPGTCVGVGNDDVE